MLKTNVTTAEPSLFYLPDSAFQEPPIPIYVIASRKPISRGNWEQIPPHAAIMHDFSWPYVQVYMYNTPNALRADHNDVDFSKSFFTAERFPSWKFPKESKQRLASAIAPRASLPIIDERGTALYTLRVYIYMAHERINEGTDGRSRGAAGEKKKRKEWECARAQHAMGPGGLD